VDVITNSSTELFVFDSDKTLETIREMAKSKEAEFPPEYGHYVNVSKIDSDDVEWVMDFPYIDVEETIQHLTMLGYKVIPPEDKENLPVQYFKISSERGGMHPKLYDFINSTFNIIRYTTDA
jgi:hypothetical protein